MLRVYRVAAGDGDTEAWQRLTKGVWLKECKSTLKITQLPWDRTWTPENRIFAKVYNADCLHAQFLARFKYVGRY